MTNPKPRVPNYPKSHLLAASGVAALLSLALLVFPSREVEAKKTFLDLQLETSAELSAGIEEPLAPIDQEKPFTQANGDEAVDDDSIAPTASNGRLDPTADPLTKEVVVSNGDTLSTLFTKVGLPASAMHEVLASSKEAKRFAHLKIGQLLQFELTEQGELARLRSPVSKLESYQVERTKGGFSFTKEHVKPEIHSAYAQGHIESSLFLAAKRAGLDHNLTMDLANVFGYDIDFAMDIRKGDSFEVIYEEKTVDGDRVGTGNILAARFTNRGKSYTAVRYTNKQGNTSYYTADGNSMRKAFIRTPVDFARISSRFSNGRKHPILNKIRAHKGVDYAAPHGTPIKSAGDGKVILAGRKGGYGNTVVIQHGNRYRTLYAHMQGFAKGVRNGASVKQGQIIGYIGTTGLSTGPHLHYEFQVDGRHVDPLGLKLPMADPIAKNEKQRFLQMSQPLMARMDEERATMLALQKQ
ncbi:peptidoglycan DD-metalloendopeptidase family protein [Stutzerimonas chloritidismutans]|uniref:peptidoglycan DD-metalloendopeptidase family protein n=1 Tax=Stutzerimonas chloritidismutans TaxID=203192 RepID=UPI003F152E9B